MDDMKQKAIPILEKALDFLRQGWTQRSFARNANKEPVNLYSLNACSFCIIGAIKKSDSSNELQDYIYNNIYNILGLGRACDLAEWNDHRDRNKQDVLDVINKTIENLKKETV